MRLGRVEFRVSYVVDLDDAEMVNHAHESVFEDVSYAAKFDEFYDSIDVVPALPTDTEDDIPEFLREPLPGDDV